MKTLTKQRLNNNIITLPKMLIVLAIAFTLFMVGTFKDFDISKYLYFESDKARIGEFLSLYLIIPAFFLLNLIAWNLLLASAKLKQYKAKNISGWIVSIIGLIVLIWREIKWFKDADFFISSNAIIWVQCILIAVILLVSTFLLSWFVFRQKEANHMFKICITAIITIAVCLLITGGLKYLIARPRPRLVFAAADPLSAYRAWFNTKLFGSTSKEYQSFPSGHTALYCCGIIAIAAISKLDMFKKKIINNLLLYIGYLGLIVIGLARIISGAHYLSDVSFSILINIVFTYSAFYIETRYIK